MLLDMIGQVYYNLLKLKIVKKITNMAAWGVPRKYMFQKKLWVNERLFSIET